MQTSTTAGRTYRPKASQAPNAFNWRGPSDVLATNPKLRHAKAGPKPTPAMQITVIGQTYGESLVAKSAHICTPTANQGQQRGFIEPSSMPYWLLAGAIAIGFALAQQLDLKAPSEFDAMQAMAEDKAAAASREWVARQTCGPEAAFEWLSDTQLQCITHRGHKSGRPVTVAVLP